ncbi:cytidine deaminase, partial [Lactarius psammicola]
NLQTLSTTDRERLIRAAPRDNAYAPYSKFRVGAAFLTPDGQIVRGANVENASYGGTICAERTAIVKAGGIQSFVALAINYVRFLDVAQPIFPCGICRQMPILLVPAGYGSADNSVDILETKVGDYSLILPRTGVTM